MTILNDGAACPLPPESCITVSDVLNYPECCTTDICCSNEVLTSNLDRAIELIEAIAQIKICPYTECKVFDGSGTCKLYFSPNTSDKLLSLTSVTVVGCSTSCPVVVETASNYGTRLEYCDNIFLCGSKNIEVCGSWGTYATIPENLKTAVILLTLEYSEPGVTGINSSQGLIDSVTWDDFSINYNTADIRVSGGDTTGYPEIDRLITAVIPTRSRIKMSLVDSPCSDCCDIYNNCCSTHNRSNCTQC